MASIARNNLVASAQNIQGAQVDCTISSLCWSLMYQNLEFFSFGSSSICLQRYLSNVQFPYCAPSEVATLNKATAYIFTDMQVYDPHITPKNKTSLHERNEQDNPSRPQTPRYDIGVIVERISLHQTKRKFCKHILVPPINFHKYPSQTPERHQHALDCYSTTAKRCGALLQWINQVA